MFGGTQPYKTLYDTLINSFSDINYDRTGRCFPAAHASGGFALISLAFCFKSRIAKIAGFILGLIAGSAMGIYQMLRGEHFLSHTLVTLITVTTMITILAKCLGLPKSTNSAHNSK